ncbi:MAG: PD40 domain-containing protein [Anaerolineales bacterium]|nr:PD40 domain-containing protein [Anaerolineales bacterium]
MTKRKFFWLSILTLASIISCAFPVFVERTPGPVTLDIDGVRQIVPAPQDLGTGRLFWSPDSTKLVFTHSRFGMEHYLSLPPKYQILIVNILSGETKQIEESDYERDVFAWLPDGQIAIFAAGDVQEGVWLMDADINEPKEFLFDSQVIWSLDGNRIALESFEYDPQTKIGTVSILVRNLAEESEGKVFKAEGTGINLDLLQWSPDGNKILFVLDDGIMDNLYAFDIVAKKPTKLSQKGYYGSASWSPDGTLIVYTYRKALDVDEHVLLYIMRSDGSCPIQLLPSNGHDIGWAMWSPDGRWIAFIWNNGIYLLDTLQVVEIELLKNRSTCP